VIVEYYFLAAERGEVREGHVTTDIVILNSAIISLLRKYVLIPVAIKIQKFATRSTYLGRYSFRFNS